MKRKQISKPLNSRNRNNNLCTGGAKNITTSFYGFWVFDSRSIKAITSNGKYSNATIQANHKLTFGCLMFLAADPLTRTLNSGFTFVRFNIKIYRQRWMDFSWNTFFSTAWIKNSFIQNDSFSWYIFNNDSESLTPRDVITCASKLSRSVDLTGVYWVRIKIFMCMTAIWLSEFVFIQDTNKTLYHLNEMSTATERDFHHWRGQAERKPAKRWRWDWKFQPVG